MKKFALLMCMNGGNRVLQECNAATLSHAIEQVAPFSPVELNDKGYAKIGDVTYTVAEYYDGMETANA